MSRRLTLSDWLSSFASIIMMWPANALAQQYFRGCVLEHWGSPVPHCSGVAGQHWRHAWLQKQRSAQEACDVGDDITEWVDAEQQAFTPTTRQGPTTPSDLTVRRIDMWLCSDSKTYKTLLCRWLLIHPVGSWPGQLLVGSWLTDSLHTCYTLGFCLPLPVL